MAETTTTVVAPEQLTDEQRREKDREAVRKARRASHVVADFMSVARDDLRKDQKNIAYLLAKKAFATLTKEGHKIGQDPDITTIRGLKTVRESDFLNQVREEFEKLMASLTDLANPGITLKGSRRAIEIVRYVIGEKVSKQDAATYRQDLIDYSRQED